MLKKGEEELPTNQAMSHHENTPTFEATLKMDKNVFIEAFLHSTYKHVLDENATNFVRETVNLRILLWKEYSVTPSQYMIQLKRTTFRYFEVKIQLLLTSLNRKLLVFKLNVAYMHTCM